jgi:predicted nuclease of predicted toxin-antitoxin system
MDFLFDENMPMRLAKGLQILDADNSLGKAPSNKIYHVQDFFAPGEPDTEVVKLAKKLKAIIVSQDSDYKKINATSALVKKLKVGYVLFKLPKKNGSTYDEIVTAFVAAWPELKKSLEDKKPPFIFIIERDGSIAPYSIK